MSAGSNTRPSLLDRLHDGAAVMSWDEFFQRYWRLIFVAARRRGCGEHTAEEIVQEVMLKVFANRDVFQYDPSRGRFRDWLGTIVRNAVAEYRRRPADRIRAVGGSDGDHALAEAVGRESSPDTAWESTFEQAMLSVLLDLVRRETTPETYQAFELLVFGELSGADTARITGLSRNGVYLAKRRVIKRLVELGAANDGSEPLETRIRDALERMPNDQIERSIFTRVERTLHSIRSKTR